MIRPCPHCGVGNRIPGKHLADTGRCGSCKRELSPASAPIDADTALFDEVTRSAKVPVLVDFWAEWCGPCKMAAPEVASAAAKLAGKAIVLKVDTEAHPELAGRYDVRSIPNFAVFREGRLVSQQAGLLRSRQLEELALRG